ncbi:MAG: hypothetical protein ACRCVA_12635 [Phreatobacter sp.]
MTFAETSHRAPAATGLHETKTPSHGLGMTPNRTAGKKNKPLQSPALDTG